MEYGVGRQSCRTWLMAKAVLLDRWNYVVMGGDGNVSLDGWQPKIFF